MSNPIPAAEFELLYTRESETELDELGVWLETSSGALGPFAFSDTRAIVRAPTWRVNLPAELTTARDILESGERRLGSAERLLALSAERINRLSEAQVSRCAQSFSTSIPFESQSERELLRFLDNLKKGEAVSFGPCVEIPADWKSIARKFQEAINHLLQILARYALVETNIQGELLGRTIVGWGGDVDTIWHGMPDSEKAVLHHRALCLAITSRSMMLKLFVAAAQMATKISVLFAIPGGAILILPAVWKFITQVRDEVEKQIEVKGLYNG